MLNSKSRRCATCKKKVNSSEALTGGLRAFCCYECLISFSKSKRGEEAVRASKRKELAERKQKLKSSGDYLKEAQAAFNRYVRLRDAHQPCISCGASLVSESLGGGYDAGHYRSRGSAGHLRFNLYNVHGQCKRCNRYLSGNVAEYRIGLVSRIGQNMIDKLESDNEQRRFDVEYLKRIKRIFTKKANKLAKKING